MSVLLRKLTGMWQPDEHLPSEEDRAYFDRTTLDALRLLASRVPCRDCHAAPDEPCRNLFTQVPLRHQPAHLHRIEDGRHRALNSILL